MSSMEKFSLKWNKYEQNIAQSFNEMREDHDFADVTLISEDRKEIKAHKVILSASSKFFKDILKIYKHSQPLIYMKGIKVNDLFSVLDFIYLGEVSVYQEDLSRFMEIADNLDLNGLSGVSNYEEQKPPINSSSSQESVSERISYTNKDASGLNTKNEYFQYESELDSQPLKTQNFSEITLFEDADIKENLTLDESFHDKSMVPLDNMTLNVTNEDLNDAVESMLEKSLGVWNCKMCGKTSGHKATLKRHIESLHTVGSSHPCTICGKIFRSSNGLTTHKSNQHRV